MPWRPENESFFVMSSCRPALGHDQLYLRLSGRDRPRPGLYDRTGRNFLRAVLSGKPFYAAGHQRLGRPAPERAIKQLLIVMLLPAVALNLVFYFTRPGFALTALIIFLFGVLETNSYPLIDSMGMQYVNAGVKIPYSFARGMGSLTYAVLCVVTGLLTARFGMQAALLAHCAEQLLLIVCLLAFPSIPARLLPQPQAKSASGHSIWQILKKNRVFTLMLIACFFGMMGVMPISNFLVSLVNSHGGGSTALGVAQFLMAASELPSALVFGLLQKKMSSAKILLISIIFMVVKPLLILASGSLGMLLAVQPVQMLGYGLFFPASVYFANESVDPADRVQGQSIRTILAISLSTLLGSLVSGYLIDLGGTTLMLWFSTGCAFIGVLIALGALAVQKKIAARVNFREVSVMSNVLVFVLELIGHGRVCRVRRHCRHQKADGSVRRDRPRRLHGGRRRYCPRRHSRRDPACDVPRSRLYPHGGCRVRAHVPAARARPRRAARAGVRPAAAGDGRGRPGRVHGRRRPVRVPAGRA